jgi:hypothetical protein
MLTKLSLGEAVDLSAAPREGRCYVVEDFDPAMDYCVLAERRWVKSIGRRRADGAVHASLDCDLHEQTGYAGLWLR